MKINSKFLKVFFVLIALAFCLGLSSGDLAPDFSLKNQNGKLIHLSDYKGKYVLVYFYPKDETPGCTKEACSLRDSFEAIKKMNTVILGVSRQDQKSHQEFIAKYKLPFDLLVDEDGKMGKSYGVGTYPLLGYFKRESVLIGPDGHVVQFYTDVDPSTHVQQVLADLKKASH